MELNRRACQLVQKLVADADTLRIAVRPDANSGRVVDMGVEVAGGLEAGIRLAEVTMSGLGRISLVPSRSDVWNGPAVQVTTDHPLAACLHSQYAGWQIKGEKFFAMGSGAMRSAAAVEELFAKTGYRESCDHAVGVLETRAFPPTDVMHNLAARCGVEPGKLSLLVAPTASQAGTVQIVARSIETALHKLLELDFDLTRVASGYGVAPLPPVADNDLAAIGRTNDAILYGAEVTLWITGPDHDLPEIGSRVPSNSSPDHGRPFAELFAKYDHDFYRMDPALFSPAVVTLISLASGRSLRSGA